MDGNKLRLEALRRMVKSSDSKDFGHGELKVIPRYKVDKSFPRFQKMYNVISKDSVNKDIRKYSQTI